MLSREPRQNIPPSSEAHANYHNNQQRQPRPSQHGAAHSKRNAAAAWTSAVVERDINMQWLTELSYRLQAGGVAVWRYGGGRGLV